MAPVGSGLPADITDQVLFLSAEQLQGLLMLLAHLFPTGPFQALQIEPLGDFHHVAQLPVGPEIPLQGRLSALRAREIRVPFFPAQGDAAPAEAVPAGDGDGILEILQADGASGFFVEAFHRVLHGSPCLPRVHFSFVIPAHWLSQREDYG